MISPLCKTLLQLAGWRIEGQLPALPKFVVIAGPHTSNWDFILGILAKGQLRIPARFIGKHQLFKPPFGWLFRALGGRPVVRTQANNLVETIAALFQQEPRFVMALSPEGTRAPVARWKTGFYHIAILAKVPIVPVAFDFRQRRIVIGDALYPGDSKAADMAQLLAFFRQFQGRFPQPIPHYRSEQDRL
ncbi:lysophospholipid acyltransferase family protein [uncultured Ferrimonas sp.]|uniref:lysophospholipid acyltransferase family protein n=1 Tax=uncultured Ferrimonas sp. TaxID=432640 RepID=UPI002622056A|nr:lysophospholipid acyltransferase family protein [uncultured Ferrimonas sp.]